MVARLVRAAAVLALVAVVLGPAASAQQPVAPGGPTGLEAVSVAHDSVSLGWDDPGDGSVTGYKILRRDRDADAPGVFATIVEDTGSADVSYVDESVEPERRYVYRVVAVNAAGESPWSGYVNVDTPAVPVPAAPGGLVAVSVAHDAVTLGWDDPGDGSVTGYRVLRRDRDADAAGVFATIAQDTGSADVSYVDESVEPQRRYVYRVVAVNAAGESPQSGYVNVDTPAEPDEPEDTGEPGEPVGSGGFEGTGGVSRVVWSVAGGSLYVGGFELDGVPGVVRFLLLTTSALYLGVDSALDADAGLVLAVGEEAFAVSDAAVLEPGGVPFTYVWDAPGVHWAVGDEVEVSLSVRGPGPAALAALGVDGAGDLEFDPDENRYDVQADPGTDTVTVNTDTAEDTTSVGVLGVRTDGVLGFDGDDADPDTPGHQVRLSASGDTLVVAATDDGTTERVYIVTVAPPADTTTARRGTGVPPVTLALIKPAGGGLGGLSVMAGPGWLGSAGGPVGLRPAPRAALLAGNDDGADSDATLAALAITGATLDGAFSANTLDYRASAESYTSQITLHAIATNANAEVGILPEDADLDVDGHQVDLPEPEVGGDPTQTAVTIAVRSADNNTLKAYTLTIARAALETAQQQMASPFEITTTLPEGCVLHDLDGSGRTPWIRWGDSCRSQVRKRGVPNAEHPDYESAPWAHAQYFRLFVSSESEVRLKSDGSGSSHLYVRTGSGDLVVYDGLEQDPNFYDAELTVTLEPGVYVVEVALHWYHWNHRRFMLEYSGDSIVTTADTALAGLGISDVNLAGFDSDTTAYARNVAADTASVTVTPTPAGSNAVVTFSPPDADGTITGHQVDIDSSGQTDVVVSVVSTVAPTARTDYRVTLTTLPGTTAPLSDDPSLSDLSLSDIDIGTFADDDTEYSYALGYYGSLNGLVTTISPTTTDSGATWTANRPDEDPGADGHQITVNGNDTIIVTVTSQDGAASRTYTLKPKSVIHEDPDKKISTLGPIGLWSDGERFLTVRFGLHHPGGPQNDSYQIHDIATGQQVEQFTLERPAELSWTGSYRSGTEGNWGYCYFGCWYMDPQAIWSDGETLWVIYLNSREHDNFVAYAFDLDTKQRAADRDIAVTNTPDLGSSYCCGSYLRGLWSDGETMYVWGNTAWNDGRIFRYDMAGGDYLGRQRISTATNHAWQGKGMWSDGQTLWMHSHPGRVMAYDLDTMQHLPGLSFDAGIPGSAEITGIWSDGHTMWVNAVWSDYTSEPESSWMGTRAFTLPENARLKKLSLDTGSLGRFMNGVFDYDAVVPAGTTSVTVTAEQAFTGGSASVAFSTTDADADADGHQVSLTPGTDSELTITVTAPNGTYTETYTLRITHDSG